jgi:hypothetical protein
MAASEAGIEASRGTTGACVDWRPARIRSLRARGCGGIGRRARFRSVWRKLRGGSSPLIRIANALEMRGWRSRCSVFETERSRAWQQFGNSSGRARVGPTALLVGGRGASQHPPTSTSARVFGSGVAENAVIADAPPDDVGFSRDELRAVFECRAAVRREGDLPHPCGPLHAVYPKPGRERRRAVPQRCDEHGQHRQESSLLLAGQPPELAVKASEPLEGRHRYAGGSAGRSSSVAATRCRCATNSSS